MVVKRRRDDSPGQEAAEPIGFRPLYRQAKDVLTARIATGQWKAGDAIPSEFEIAADLQLSQGTVRKALDEMAAERIVVRHQGKGTFVARHDDARILFQFFKLVPDDGERGFPESRVLSVELARARAEEVATLGLGRGARVLRLVRERSLAGKVAVFERIVLPADRFGKLAEGSVPNNLYQLYAERFGVTIAGARERLKAVASGTAESRSLAVQEGTPLLLVDRVATDLSGNPVEWRLSHCLTEDLHYQSDLT